MRKALVPHGSEQSTAVSPLSNTDFFATVSGPTLCHHELLLNFFVVLVADRQGLSFYSYDKICSLLTLRLDDYILARDSLIDKDLLAFNGTFFQVLSLPAEPVQHSKVA